MFQSQTILDMLMTYRYALLFPLACLEGPLVAIIVGFFIHLGFLSLVPSYALLILGDFFSDSFFYYIGRFKSKAKVIKEYGLRETIFSKHFNSIEKLWHTHGIKTMFFSKLAYGLSIPLLISAGVARIIYRKFIFYAFLVSIFQYGVFLALGYYFGQSYALAAHYVKFVGVIIAGIGIVFITIYLLIKRYAKKQIINMEKQK